MAINVNKHERLFWDGGWEGKCMAE